VIAVYKGSKVHFLTAYVEYLLDIGIRSEEYYLGDASRFIRYLLSNVTIEDVNAFIDHCAQTASYKNRLQKTLKRFFMFGNEILAIDNFANLIKTDKSSQ